MKRKVLGSGLRLSGKALAWFGGGLAFNLWQGTGGYGGRGKDLGEGHFWPGWHWNGEALYIDS